MPTHLKQHVNRLCSVAMNCNDDAHCSLRHHHYAMVCYKGRCVSRGHNRKSCLLRGYSERKKRKKEQRIENCSRRMRRHRKSSRKPSTPAIHQLPISNPIPPKIKQCRYVKTVRRL